MRTTWAARRLTVPLAACALFLAACNDAPGSVTDGSSGVTGNVDVTASELVHIHRLQEAPGGGLFVATHMGLFKVDGDDIERVGEAAHDLMGFTVAGPNDLLASGHPDLRVDELMVEGKPPLLGLAQSSDGQTWKPLSLLGEVDFHSLVTAHDRVYGLDSQTGALMVSRDRTTWETRGKGLPFGDLAVSPTDADVLVAAAPDGVVKSGDGGRSWKKAGPQQAAYLSWTDEGLFAVSPNGAVMRSDDSGGTWQPLGSVEGSPAAFLVAEGEIYVAVHEAGIMQSTDGGKSFEFLIRTPKS